MIALSRGIHISLKIQSRSSFISPWYSPRPVSFLSDHFHISKGPKNMCSSTGPVPYVLGSCAGGKRAPKFQSLESCEDDKDEGLLKTSGSRRGRLANRSLDKISLTKAIPKGSKTESKSVSSHVENFHEIRDFTDTELDHVDEHLITSIGRKSEEGVRDAAVRLLAARAYTAAELRKKLICRKHPLKVVESVLSDLQNRGFLNDGFYAESFSRSRWLTNSWGPRRIKRALLEKGVSEKDANKATSQVFGDGDSSESGFDQLPGMSKPSLDHLILQASKQWLRGKEKSLEKRRSGIIRWLQYRGFDWGVTKFILKKLESEYPI